MLGCSTKGKGTTFRLSQRRSGWGEGDHRREERKVVTSLYTHYLERTISNFLSGSRSQRLYGLICKRHLILLADQLPADQHRSESDERRKQIMTAQNSLQRRSTCIWSKKSTALL